MELCGSPLYNWRGPSCPGWIPGLLLFLIMNYGHGCLVTQASQNTSFGDHLARVIYWKVTLLDSMHTSALPAHLGAIISWMKNCQATTHGAVNVLGLQRRAPPRALLLPRPKGCGPGGQVGVGDEHWPITMETGRPIKNRHPEEEASRAAILHFSEGPGGIKQKCWPFSKGPCIIYNPHPKLVPSTFLL